MSSSLNLNLNHRLFSDHPAYAEDQPYAHSILITHVLHRAYQTGAFIGLVRCSPLLFRRSGPTTSPNPIPTPVIATPTSTTAATPLPPTPANPRVKVPLSLLPTTGRYALYTTLGTAIFLPIYMHDQSLIQWQDRSWRLMEHRGQNEVDDFGVLGSVLGGVYGVAGSGTGPRVWRVLGGVAIGNLVGVGCYMGWRYGVKGGKYDEAL